jgi:predicted flap endonuclease-1-like 5' DNA nuclease
VLIGLAFLLGLLAGWLLWGGHGRSRASEALAPTSPAVPTLPPAPVVKMPLAAPGMHDDLERIEGIGPQLAAALHQAGIHTYAQLAVADEDTLRTAIEVRGLRFAPSLATWARQAQLLADGDEHGFADLTRRLVAGRDEGRE